MWITSGYNVYGKHINIFFPTEPGTFIQHFIIHRFFGRISFLRKVKLPTNNIPQADTREGRVFKENEQWDHYTLRGRKEKQRQGRFFILHTHPISRNILARAWSTNWLDRRLFNTASCKVEIPAVAFQPQLSARGCDAAGAHTCPAEQQWLQNAEVAASTFDRNPSRVSGRCSNSSTLKFPFLDAST